MVITFTDKEKRILKRFVKALQDAKKELKKNDGAVRNLNLTNIIKNMKED